MMEPSELGSAFGLEQLKKLQNTLKKEKWLQKITLVFFQIIKTGFICLLWMRIVIVLVCISINCKTRGAI